MGQCDSWQACQGGAEQLEVGAEGGGTLQLKCVGPRQGGQKKEGEWAGLLR